MCDCNFPEEIISGDSKFFGKKKSYFNWYNMKRRCYRLGYKDYKDYGARGIRVCEQWLSSFARYYADVGDAPPGMTIDRKDNDKGYCPHNFRWATKRTQSLNRRKFQRDGNLPRGVTMDRNSFRAQIKIEGTSHYIGNFKTMEEADTAFRERYRKEHGRYPDQGTF